MRKALPYLGPQSPSLASPFHTLRQSSSRQPPGSLWLFLPNPAWLSPSCLLFLENMHSSKSFKTLSHYQSSGISAEWHHPSNTCKYLNRLTTWLLFKLMFCFVFNIWKQKSRGVNHWNSTVPPLGVTFQLWHLQAVWPKVGLLILSEPQFSSP